MLSIAAEVISTLPGLLMVVVILFCTRLFIRALDSFFNNVESGVLEVQWMLPETAKATRRIASMMVWLFAITVAYPYVPGSSSDAFKGVSVFAGLLLTLGSAGMVNQVMSGLVVVYSRMMKPGDMIKVGEVAGQVVELGFLSTKVRTERFISWHVGGEFFSFRPTTRSHHYHHDYHWIRYAVASGTCVINACCRTYRRC